METGQDERRKRQITGQEKPFRVKPEKKGRGNKQGLDDIDDEDGLGMIKPEAYQLVVKMVLVGRKERPPLRDPLRHDRKRVEHRKTQDHERQKGAQGVCPWVSASDRLMAEKPRNWLPVSPMNSSAGYVLYLRKPNMEPARARARRHSVKSSSR